MHTLTHTHTHTYTCILSCIHSLTQTHTLLQTHLLTKTHMHTHRQTDAHTLTLDGLLKDTDLLEHNNHTAEVKRKEVEPCHFICDKHKS